MSKRLKYYFKLILRLIKFRLSLMITFSAVIGYLLAKQPIDINILLIFIGVFFLAGGSSGINQFQERKMDALMKRTRKRPIPSGLISPERALIVSTLFSVTGFLVLLTIGLIPAVLGILNLIFYNFAYTPLKTKSPLSIIPGAVVGAIPPMIGWTGAGGSIMHPNIIFISIFMFSWQLPHFWLLMIVYGREYEMAGFSSISKYFNQNQIKTLVFIWTLGTSIFLFFFPLFKISLSKPIMILLISVNVLFISFFYRLIFGNTEAQKLRRAFIAINSYMMLVLFIFILNLVA